MKNVSARLLWLQCMLLAAGSAAAQTAVNSRPCKESPEYRGMDFWIGEWEVSNALSGAPAGINTIELVLDGCIILENWTGRNGYSGKSFNLYHPETSKWEQLFVDNQGQMTRYEGEAKDGNIYYRSERVDENGKKVPMKMTFFPKGPDQLRQLGEASTDGGATWTVEYDLLYKRKK